MGCTAEQLTAPRTVLIEILYRLFAPGKVWVIAQTCLPVGLNIKFHPYGQQSLHGWMDGWMDGGHCALKNHPAAYMKRFDP